jgi:hypothetical protein
MWRFRRFPNGAIMRINRFCAVAFGLSMMLGAQANAATYSESFDTPSLNSPPSIQYGPDTFSYNTNAVGPVVIPNFTFVGFSGIEQNGSYGVFPNATSGTQAAFLQSYLFAGSEIVWALSGLTIGNTYKLSFDAVGSLIIPAETFTVSALGATPVSYTPGSAYTTYTLSFTPSTSSGNIDFLATVLASNQASAIDSLSVTATPLPSTWLMLLSGFVGLGFFAYRGTKKNSAALAAA